jgi:hypothetical protein
MMKYCLLLAAMCGLLAIASAATTTPEPETINPACAEAPFRDFDFWIGIWDVNSPDGKTSGVNRITSEEGGCLLVERWSGVSGSTGQSYNYVDRKTGLWRQIWVSSGFTIDYSGGLDPGGIMRLEGTIAYAQTPENNGPFRGAWTPRDDGTVEQSFHQWSEDAEEWVPWFIGIYTKQSPEEKQPSSNKE